jgi:predicted nucleotidyltransferase
MGESRRAQIRAGIAKVLADEPDVIFAYLFGSTLSADSVRDVDVAVLLDPQRTGTQGYVDAKLRMMARLEPLIGIQVDVVILNDAPLGLRLAAVRGVVVHSRDEATRQEFVERTALQAMDSAFLRRESLRDVLVPRLLNRSSDSPGPAGST